MISMKNVYLTLALLYLNPFVVLEAKPRKKENIELALNFPPEFGRTHFIIGFPHEEVVAERIAKNAHLATLENVSSENPFGLINDGAIKQVYFAPDYNIHDLLVYLIRNEKESIKIAAFMFTDRDIAQELIAAQSKGVHLEIIVDPGCVKDNFSKVTILEDSNIDVFVYDPNYKKNSKKGMICSLMHNKFFIFKNNIHNKEIIVTGSLNLTKSAQKIHQENTLVLSDRAIWQKYNDHFEILKSRCYAQKKKHVKTNKTLLSKKGTVFDQYKTC